jgi:methylmalonyl-CoA/ethylmalonyl-CoA epimerase
MGLEKKEQPVFDTSGNNITQVGIVVKDAVKTARQFAELLGIGPWVFFDEVIQNGNLHGETLKKNESCLRLAFAYLGDFEIELLQPLWGPSSHQEFLETHGEGVHHLSFGGIENSALFVSALKSSGIQSEMLGKVSGDISFAYMSTQKALGTIFEATTPITETVESSLTPWGTLRLEKQPVTDMTEERIIQIGIVVDNLSEITGNYERLFGVGPWSNYYLKPPHTTFNLFNDLHKTDDVNTYVRAASADLGNICIELVEPVCGPGSHMNFLKSCGPGVFYVSFGTVKDHDKIVKKMGQHDIGIDMAGEYSDGLIWTNLATQQELGTIIQMTKGDPDIP